MILEKFRARELHLEQIMAGFGGEPRAVICVGKDCYAVASPTPDRPGTELEANFITYLGKGKPVLYTTAITACFMPGIVLAQSPLSSRIYYRDSNSPYIGDIDINAFFMNVREQLENLVLEEMIDTL